MNNLKQHIPVYQQFIIYLEKGFAALNVEQQSEIKEFIHSCQHRNGAFTDRAGLPDYYYSLFGTWLSIATGQVNTIKLHKQFILQTIRNSINPVDEFAFFLIKTSLLGEKSRKPSFFHLLKITFIKSGHVSLFYRLFLFILLVDALYRARILFYAARGFLLFVSPPAGSPCSIWAAYMIVRHKVGFSVKKEKKVLLEYFEIDKGFKAYRDISEADLLSTAVALVALKNAGVDFRMIAPDCLRLIQNNYSEGAFLAGNGDKEHDLEYTFYGLLALGLLV